MNIQKINYEKLNETIHQFEHHSGLKVFVIPKKGYSKTYATFSTHFGSINRSFIIPGVKEVTTVPDGVAHFLEHKLFEQKDGSVMDKFAALGSNPNAYTGFSQTVYLFSCTDRFDDNFKLLLDFVQNPYITEESVEKEKGIIGQEIRMYEDDPNWRCFFNLLGSFYHENPVKRDIAGTIDSIQKINRDVLYQCYNTFYNPSNMVILVVGDVKPEVVFAQVDQCLQMTQGKSEIIRVFPEEKEEINKNYVEQKLAVSTPMFQMGFKDNRLNTKGMEGLRQEIAVKLLLEMIMGKSSVLYTDLYEQGLINTTFGFDYSIEENFAFSMFGGESKNPEKVKEMIVDTIKTLQVQGLDVNAYQRIRKAMKGKYLKTLNSVERISHSFISVYFKGVTLFDYYESYDTITFEYVNEVFRDHFNLNHLALSVIRPN